MYVLIFVYYTLYSLFYHTLWLYIYYSLVWWLWWGWSNSVSHFVLDKVCCLWVHIFIFYYTISYIMYHIQCVFINIYKVGGFKHFLFSISYMGWYPSHWRTPSFFKLVKTTNQIYMENPAFINQVLGRLVVKAWPWDHPSLLVLKSQRCSICFPLERPSTGVYEPVFGSHMNFWKTSILQIGFPLCSLLCATNKGKL